MSSSPESHQEVALILELPLRPPPSPSLEAGQALLGDRPLRHVHLANSHVTGWVFTTEAGDIMAAWI